MVVRMVGALVIILGLMALVAWYLRRYAPGFRGGDASLIEVRASRMVAPKHYVSVVRVGERELVLGLSEQGMTLLTELQGSHGPGEGFASRLEEAVAASSQGQGRG